MRKPPWVGWQLIGGEWEAITSRETWKETYARLRELLPSVPDEELTVLRRGTHPTAGVSTGKARLARANGTPVQAAVLEQLQSGPATAAELEQRTGKPRGYVSRALGILAKKGYVYRGDSSKARSAGNRAAILWYLTRQEGFAS